ncbi:MAG: rod shape-determining protein MreD [Lachnospiraceae bacterium]|jgi:rod shape-determining protein MreD
MWRRIRNFFIMFILILVSFLLQFSVFILIPEINCAPNLMLILTFAFAFTRDKNAGMLVGFFSGLFVDVFYCQVIGYNALILLLIGLICGALKKLFYSNTFLSQIIILMIFDLLNALVYYFVWFILHSRFAFWHSLVHVIIPEFIFTLLMGIILFKPLTLLIKRMYLHYDLEADNI